MHFINGSYTTYINIKRKRSGHLFQGRYKSIVVDKDNYLLELSRYIHLNPVKAGIVQRPEDYLYSSYTAYLNNRKDAIVTKDIVLELFSGQKGKAKEKYRRFVQGATGKQLNDPMEKVYGGIILGQTGFIKEVLKKIKEEYYNRDEVANRKALRAVYGIEEVLQAVLNHSDVTRAKIVGDKFSEQKKIAIYLMKERTEATNREIGEFFEGLSYSAIAKIYHRFRKEMKGNRKLRRRVAQIENHLSFVKG